MADENYYQHDRLDYPFIEGLPRAIDDLDLPYPSSFFVQIDDEYPFLLDLPVELQSSSPYPSSFFVQNENVNDGYPYIDLPDKLNASEPVPWSFFMQKADVNDGYPYLDTSEEIKMGAFCYARNLKKVKIPRSVKKIGQYSFTNTNLSEVIIAKDCSFYDTSFPEECIINYYED